MLLTLSSVAGLPDLSLPKTGASDGSGDGFAPLMSALLGAVDPAGTAAGGKPTPPLGETLPGVAAATPAAAGAPVSVDDKPARWVSLTDVMVPAASPAAPLAARAALLATVAAPVMGGLPPAALIALATPVGMPGQQVAAPAPLITIAPHTVQNGMAKPAAGPIARAVRHAQPAVPEAALSTGLPDDDGTPTAPAGVDPGATDAVEPATDAIVVAHAPPTTATLPIAFPAEPASQARVPSATVAVHPASVAAASVPDRPPFAGFDEAANEPDDDAQAVSPSPDTGPAVQGAVPDVPERPTASPDGAVASVAILPLVGEVTLTEQRPPSPALTAASAAPLSAASDAAAQTAPAATRQASLAPANAPADGPTPLTPQPTAALQPQAAPPPPASPAGGRPQDRAVASASTPLVPAVSLSVALPTPEVPLVATTALPNPETNSAAPRTAQSAAGITAPTAAAPERSTTTAPPQPGAALAPNPAPATVIQPALHAFGAAIRQALADERAPIRRSGTDLAAPLVGTTAAATPGVTAPAASDATLDTTDHRWPHAMAVQIERLRDAADAGSTRIRLIPDALGPIDLAVRREGEAVHVHFTAADPATRQLLADAQPQLAQAATDRGLRLGRTEVSGGDPSGGNSPGGDRRPRAPAPPVPLRPAAPRAVADTADDLQTRIA